MIPIAFVLILVFAFILRVYKIVLVEKFNGKIYYSGLESNTAKDYFVSKEYNFFNWFSKLKLKYVYSFCVVMILLLFNISANVSIWPNVKGLTIEDKQKSIEFRHFRGSNCISEFSALLPALEVGKLNNYTTSDIIRLLGEPNIKDKETNTFEYYLYAGENTCKGIIKFDNNDTVIASYINGCK